MATSSSSPRNSYFPLPIRFEEISAEWLTAALQQRTAGVEVRSVQIIDMMRSTTTKIRLRLELNETAKAAGIPERVILKGGFEEHSQELHRMHLREVRSYRDILPAIPLPSPACYFADYDEQGRQGIIIMEDLVQRGVSFCHALEPQSHEQIARRLTALARFHAASWNSPELGPAGKWHDLPEFFPIMRGFFDRYSSPEQWQKYCSLPRGAASSLRFLDRDWLTDSWNRMSDIASGLPHCVLHGDIHLGNLYIDSDGSPGFFDMLASRGPGMLEVSYHISASMDLADRRHSEAALVQHYLDELRRAGADAPDFNEAMRQYAIFLLYGHFIWMTTDPYKQPESVNTANEARVTVAMIDHDCAALLKQGI